MRLYILSLIIFLCLVSCQNKPTPIELPVTVISAPVVAPPTEAQETAQAIKEFYPLIERFEKLDFSLFGAESHHSSGPACLDVVGHNKYAQCIRNDIESVKPALAIIPTTKYSSNCANSVRNHALWYVNGRYQFLQDELAWTLKHPSQPRENGHYSHSYSEKELSKYHTTNDVPSDRGEPDFGPAVFVQCFGDVFNVYDNRKRLVNVSTMKVLAGALHVFPSERAADRAALENMIRKGVPGLTEPADTDSPAIAQMINQTVNNMDYSTFIVTDKQGTKIQ
jgi:hypothetical protein